MRNKKKLIIGLAVGAASFAAVFAMAASLTVGSNSLGAGNAGVASCDTNGVDHVYTTAFSGTLPGYRVATVDVTGIATECDTFDIKATLLDGAGASLGEYTGVVNATGTHSFTVGGNVPAASVEDIAVVISE